MKSTSAAAFVMWVAAAMASMHAAAQPHEATAAGYTLRSSIVGSRAIAEETARKHGIEQRAGMAILNVVVSKAGAPAAGATVAASIEATSRTLVGLVRRVELHPVRAGGYLSYFGSVEHSSREVLDFDISATPAGSDRPLTLHYRETLPAY